MNHNPLESNSRRLYQYDLLRVILTFLVVLGHATFLDIRTIVGGISYGNALKEAGLPISSFQQSVSLLSDWIYSFHMPLFMALSGTIFASKKNRQGVDKEFGPYIKRYAKRLLIPFAAVWLLWNVPIKLVTGYYDAGILGIIMQMIVPANVYLWYLESLFFVFFLIYFVNRLSDSILKICVVLLLWLVGIVLYRKYGSYHFLGDPLYYLFWFYVGTSIMMVIEELEERRILTNTTIILLLFAQVILFNTKKSGVPKIVDAGLQYIVLPLMMVFVAYYFVNHVRIVNKDRMAFLSSYCKGVYLYAEPLNYFLLWLFYRRFGIGVFSSQIGSLVLWCGRVFLTTLTAVGITRIIKKTKLKYLS